MNVIIEILIYMVITFVVLLIYHNTTGSKELNEFAKEHDLTDNRSNYIDAMNNELNECYKFIESQKERYYDMIQKKDNMINDLQNKIKELECK